MKIGFGAMNTPLTTCHKGNKTCEIKRNQPTKTWMIKLFTCPGGASRAVWVPPQRTITPSGTNGILSWPNNAVGCTLEYATNRVSPIAWNANSTGQGVIGGQRVQPDRHTAEHQHYRATDNHYAGHHQHRDGLVALAPHLFLLQTTSEHKPCHDELGYTSRERHRQRHDQIHHRQPAGGEFVLPAEAVGVRNRKPKQPLTKKEWNKNEHRDSNYYQRDRSGTMGFSRRPRPELGTAPVMKETNN